MKHHLSIMPCRLRVVSGEAAAAAFQKAGFKELKGRGKNHILMGKPGLAAQLSIPRHRELKRGLLRALIRKSGLSVDEFYAYVSSR